MYRPCSCEWCGRTFENTKGRSNHKRSCVNRPNGWVYGEESDDAQPQDPSPKVCGWDLNIRLPHNSFNSRLPHHYRKSTDGKGSQKTGAGGVEAGVKVSVTGAGAIAGASTDGADEIEGTGTDTSTATVAGASARAGPAGATISLGMTSPSLGATGKVKRKRKPSTDDGAGFRAVEESGAGGRAKKNKADNHHREEWQHHQRRLAVQVRRLSLTFSVLN